jgi:hypothetical protein
MLDLGSRDPAAARALLAKVNAIPHPQILTGLGLDGLGDPARQSAQFEG